jgi:CBS domain-containing protein
MDLREPLASETIANAGYRQPVTVEVDARIRDVIATMREHRVGCAIVVDGAQPVGIFTERDLVKRVYAKGVALDTPVRELMTANPVVTHTEAPLYVAMAHMLRGGFRHLPVLDTQGALVGTTSIKRTVHFLADHLPEAILNLPPSPGQYPATQEGG